MEYIVRYEIEATPSNVIVEIACKDESTMIEEYENRRHLKKLQKIIR